MNDCVFCKMIAKEIDIQENLLYENDKIMIMLDSDLVVKGHALVIWKEHHTNLSDLSEDDYAYFSKTVHRTEKIVLDLCHMDRSINLKSGGIHPHFHFHIYPIGLQTSWRDIHDMIEKDPRYRDKTFLYGYAAGEKEGLIHDFREKYKD